MGHANGILRENREQVTGMFTKPAEGIGTETAVHVACLEVAH